MTTAVETAPVATTPLMVNLTERAIAEVHTIRAQQNIPETTYLRIGVLGGGCSGFQYDFRFDDQYDAAKDYLGEQGGLKVIVAKKCALHLEGTTIDFYEGVERRGFKFDNPHAQKTCGCGSSFSA